jgi:hypothetical protein
MKPMRRETDSYVALDKEFAYETLVSATSHLASDPEFLTDYCSPKLQARQIILNLRRQLSNERWRAFGPSTAIDPFEGVSFDNRIN